MNKKMRYKYIFVILILVIILALTNIRADVYLGNETFDIGENFAKKSLVTGWINISLVNEPSSSLVTGFNSEMELIDFLRKNNADMSCNPIDCNKAYNKKGTKFTSKTFDIEYKDSQLIGVYLQGDINEVNDFDFTITSNSGKSCVSPITIDVLDDDIIDYKSVNVSEDFTCNFAQQYGCYNKNDAEGMFRIMGGKTYCGYTKIYKGARYFQLGAEVMKLAGTSSDNVDFVFELITDYYYDECETVANKTGTITCNILFDGQLEKASDALFCFSLKDESQENLYEIYYESKEPCGHVSNEDGTEVDYDFPIFIKSAKYNGETLIQIGDSQEEIDYPSEIMQYIFNKYDGNCSAGCVIPIRINSGINQKVTVDNLNVIHSISGLLENNFYEVEETDVLISADYNKYNLESANITTPMASGDFRFLLEIGGEDIIDETISIEEYPELQYIFPSKVLALEERRFLIKMSKNLTNATYNWDFGDDTFGETTNVPYVDHTYKSTGSYFVKVTVNDQLSKTFTVTVQTPIGNINSTINDYLSDISQVESDINGLSPWMQDSFSKSIDIVNIKDDVLAKERKYKSAVEDSEFVEIMQDLTNMDIPYKLYVTQEVDYMNLLVSEDRYDLDLLAQADIGTFEGIDTEFAGALNTWIKDNLDAKVSVKSYSVQYRGKDDVALMSHIKLTLEETPDSDFSDLYVIIPGNTMDTKIMNEGNYKVKEVGEDAKIITFLDYEGTESIEFIVPGEVDIGNLPVYVTPDENDYPVPPEFSDCNNNGVCDSIENYKNCRRDCKPIFWTIFFLILLIILALVVYIVLQEWYKRKYEAYLFKNKNDLFNIIHFMYNSETQGMKKNEIFNQLRKKGWNNEQLNYAWNKLHGKRTGMWEIPVLKWVENKQVKKELSKRKGNSANINIKGKNGKNRQMMSARQRMSSARKHVKPKKKSFLGKFIKIKKSNNKKSGKDYRKLNK